MQHKHLIQLSQPQIRKMQNHQTIQIKQADLMKGNTTIYVDEKINKKILTAHRNGKGIRLNPTDYTMQPMNGAGIGKIKKHVSKALKTTKHYAKYIGKELGTAVLFHNLLPIMKDIPGTIQGVKDGYNAYNDFFNSPYTVG